MTDGPSVGERLAAGIRSARERLGLTQDALASAIGVARSAISDIESGKREVSALELATLADLLGESMERLLGLAEPAPDAELVMLRAANVTELSRIELARWIRRCGAYREIETATGEVRETDLRPVQRILSRFEQAHELAEEERMRLGLGLTPAHELLDALEERLGVKVLFADLEDSCSGASVESMRFGPAILVNRSHVAGRRAFTLAHEYFHLLTAGRVTGARGAQALHLCESEPPDAPAKRKDRGEQFADQFAGRLLLPPEHFIERLKTLHRPDGTIERLDLIGLARYFGVSVQAVFVQLAGLKLVPWTLAKEAYADPSFQEHLASAGPANEGPKPKRFDRLVIKAFVAGAISRSRVAELLDVNIADVDEEVQRFGGDGAGGGIRVTLPR
jgi:Zn-dependent peptidase ImmA (M78 family)/DNA-binding XRE family transcriptional regulator